VKGIIRFLFFIVVVYTFLTGVIGLFRVNETSETQCTDQFLIINQDNDRLHQREWELLDYTHSFCASYSSIESISLETGKNRNEIITDTNFDYENFWGSVYQKMVEDSRSNIQFLVDSLKDISKAKQLSQRELAELVVTFVQDIPYSYVRVEDCSEADNKGKPCIGHIALGLLSPYEFLHSLFGDCDTRAVLIYALLEEMGFDPMIVISNEYAHAMLALNIPAAGDHLKYRGQNYYFWETTGKGWPLGMLPPNSNNVNYWKVALVN
jgi:hypothetical protein